MRVIQRPHSKRSLKHQCSVAGVPNRSGEAAVEPSDEIQTALIPSRAVAIRRARRCGIRTLSLPVLCEAKRSRKFRLRERATAGFVAAGGRLAGRCSRNRARCGQAAAVPSSSVQASRAYHHEWWRISFQHVRQQIQDWLPGPTRPVIPGIVQKLGWGEWAAMFWLVFRLQAVSRRGLRTRG